MLTLKLFFPIYYYQPKYIIFNHYDLLITTDSLKTFNL